MDMYKNTVPNNCRKHIGFTYTHNTHGEYSVFTDPNVAKQRNY